MVEDEKTKSDKKHKDHKKEKSKKSHTRVQTRKISKKKLVLLGVGLVVGIVIGLAISSSLSFTGTSIGSCGDSLGNDAQEYVVSNFLEVQGLDAEIGTVEQVGGLCKVDLSIVRDGEKLQDTQVYMTPNGEQLILGQVIDTTEQVPEPTGDATANTNEPQTKSCDDFTKTDNPELDAFVVSYCPYGLQMQRVLAKAVEEAPELADYINVRYMGSIANGKVNAMHGEKEALENSRQICLREEQPDKFWEYLNCFMKSDDYETCLEETSVDTTKLDECMSGDKLLEYAQEDFDLQKEYSVTGSPTLILNGERAREFDFGGRTADALRQVICCGFSEEPEVCSTEITTSEAATSFSETYSSGGAPSGGSC